MRYARHISFEKIGKEGQKKINGSKVAIVGLGGLGSPVSMYLTASGVGEITVIDNDVVKEHDLPRQIIYREKDIGKKKALVAKSLLKSMNPMVNIRSFGERLDKNNVKKIIGKPGLVMDCTDNLETRFLINDFCFKEKIPVVHAAVVQDRGWVSFMQPGETPCIRCIMPPNANPKNSSEIGVLSTGPGVIGTVQATEAIKYLAGFGNLLKNRMLFVELSTNDYSIIKIKSKKGCEICSIRQ